MSIRKNTLPTTALSSKSFRAFSDWRHFVSARLGSLSF